MLAYYKIINYLFSINIVYIQNQRMSSGFKYSRKILNVGSVLSNIYRSLNIINVVSRKKGVVLFVGTTKEIQKLNYFFKFKLKRTFFITKWINGFLTNWNYFIKFISIFENPTQFVKTSKKLRFLRFFLESLNKKKPDLIVFINPSEPNLNVILIECFLENIPTIVFSENKNKFSTYAISTNSHNFYSHWFFIQLFHVQQFRLLKKMLTKFKKFKFSKKFGTNVFNDPYFSSKILKKSFSNRTFNIFLKPFGQYQTTFFWVSNYYANHRLEKTKNIFYFFKRQKKKSNVVFSNILDFILVQASFFKTIRQARLFISLGFILLNGKVVTKANIKLNEGDIVSFKTSVLNRIRMQWLFSNFSCSYNIINVFKRLPFYLEYSYSTGSFCFCFKPYLGWTVNSMEECFFYTEKVSGSNPLLSKFFINVTVYAASIFL